MPKLCDRPPYFTSFVVDKASLNRAKRFISKSDFRIGHVVVEPVNNHYSAPIEKFDAASLRNYTIDKNLNEHFFSRMNRVSTDSDFFIAAECPPSDALITFFPKSNKQKKYMNQMGRFLRGKRFWQRHGRTFVTIFVVIASAALTALFRPMVDKYILPPSPQ